MKPVHQVLRERGRERERGRGRAKIRSNKMIERNCNKDDLMIDKYVDMNDSREKYLDVWLAWSAEAYRAP